MAKPRTLSPKGTLFLSKKLQPLNQTLNTKHKRKQTKRNIKTYTLSCHVYYVRKIFYTLSP